MHSPDSETPLSPIRDLQRRVDLEVLVARISLSFAGLKPGQLDDAITRALADVGAFVGADRSYVFLYDLQRQTTSNTHEWCAGGISAQRENLQDIPMAAFPYLMARLSQEVVVDIPVVSELPTTAAPEKANLEGQGIQSLVLMSMRDRTGQTIGFVGLDSVQEVRPWFPNDLNLLQITCDLITAALENQNLWGQLTTSETRNRAILKALPDTLVTFDQRGTVLDLQISKADPHPDLFQDLLHRGIPEFLGQGQAPVFHEALARLDAGENPVVSVFSIQRDSHDLDFEFSLTSYGSGEYLALVRDITQRRLDEAALRSLALELGAVEEAQRWELALFLHDGIGQDLSALHYQLQACLEDPDTNHERLQDMIPLLQSAMKKTQDLTFDLSPPLLHELGLIPALQALVRKFDRDYKARFNFTAMGEAEPHDATSAILLFRIARELLHNTVKHAEADQVEVELHSEDCRFLLVVADNGRGLPSPLDSPLLHESQGGFGLFSILQRIKPLGGTLAVGEGPGTRITIALPCSGAENRDETKGQP